MPEIDLTNAAAIRIKTRDALAVRVANVTVWESPAPFVEYTTFQNAAPTDSYTVSYNYGSDLGGGGWTANTFFSYGAVYPGATVAGLKYWVPAGSPLIGESITISIYQSPTPASGGWPDVLPATVMDALVSSEFLTAFPEGTLVEGWNDLRFEHHIPLQHYQHFLLGVSVGDGSKYIYSEPPSNNTLYPAGNGRIALSGDFGGGEPQRRGAYRRAIDNESYWSPGHYGIDAIIQVPITDTLYDHSIWSNVEPVAGWYHTYNGLGTQGWTASHFYGKSSFGQDENWSLVGARLWVPPADRDTNNIVGMSAQCGYYVKSTDTIINTDENSPLTIINGLKATAQTPITLQRGWNEVYFPSPISIPIDAGFAVGWTIGDGDVYVSAGLEGAPQRAFDLSPFFLASSDNTTSERRGVYIDGDGAAWSYQNNHYGADIIVRRPESP